MRARIHSFLNYPIVVYAAPYVLFAGLGLLEGSTGSSTWYPFWYAVKTALVAAAWWHFRARYPKPSSKGVGLGVTVGVLGIVIWVVLSRLALPTEFVDRLPSWLQSAGTRSAYDPFSELSSPFVVWAFLAVRMTGLVVIVPLMEEVFWRGFVLRYVVDENFENVPQGQFTPASFAAVTLLFAATHPEFLAALAWGALANYLYYRTRNLWACIVAHAVTNLLLGLYIVSTASWHLW